MNKIPEQEPVSHPQTRIDSRKDIRLADAMGTLPLADTRQQRQEAPKDAQIIEAIPTSPARPVPHPQPRRAATSRTSNRPQSRTSQFVRFVPFIIIFLIILRNIPGSSIVGGTIFIVLVGGLFLRGIVRSAARTSRRTTDMPKAGKDFWNRFWNDF